MAGNDSPGQLTDSLYQPCRIILPGKMKLLLLQSVYLRVQFLLLVLKISYTFDGPSVVALEILYLIPKIKEVLTIRFRTSEEESTTLICAYVIK